IIPAIPLLVAGTAMRADVLDWIRNGLTCGDGDARQSAAPVHTCREIRTVLGPRLAAGRDRGTPLVCRLWPGRSQARASGRAPSQGRAFIIAFDDADQFPVLDSRIRGGKTEP